MPPTSLIVFVGVLLGVLQLSVGVVVGLRLGRRSPQRGPDSGPDTLRATQLASDLRGLTENVAASVRQHRDVLNRADQRLRAEQPSGPGQDDDAPLTSLVVGVIGEVLSANQQLQKDLTHAELRLDQQADELAEHRERSLTDPLTGLPNRRSLEEHLRTRIDAWRKHGESFSVVMLDVDHFKRFNDTHGHQTGDAALVAFGNAVADAVRKQDLVARYGGEEFAVLLPHTRLDEAAAAVEKIRQAVAGCAVQVGAETLSITASGGLASIASHESTELLIGRADEALYAAKEAGRDRFYLHTGSQAVPCEKGNDDRGDSPDASPADCGQLESACADLRSGLDKFLRCSTDESPTETPA